MNFESVNDSAVITLLENHLYRRFKSTTEDSLDLLKHQNKKMFKKRKIFDYQSFGK